MSEPFKIQGLSWDGLSVLQSKQQQNFVEQELARYQYKTNYLARLKLMKVQPTPVEEFTPHDPCSNGIMLKLEWSNKDVTQVRNSHYPMIILLKGFRTIPF